MEVNTLIEEAKKAIDRGYEKGKHQVGSAILTKSGKIYTGFSINAQKMDICAEWVAVGKAFSEGEKDIKMIASVKRNEDGTHEILPPCGLCRELQTTYFPDAEIILSTDKKVKATDLLPNPWQKKKMTAPGQK